MKGRARGTEGFRARNTKGFPTYWGQCPAAIHTDSQQLRPAVDSAARAVTNLSDRAVLGTSAQTPRVGPLLAGHTEHVLAWVPQATCKEHAPNPDTQPAGYSCHHAMSIRLLRALCRSVFQAHLSTHSPLYPSLSLRLWHTTLASRPTSCAAWPHSAAALPWCPPPTPPPRSSR